MTLKIQVKLFASLREGRFKVQDIVTAGPKRVAELVLELGLPPEEIAIIMINGRRMEADTVLEDGDVLALFPAVGGG